MARLQFQRMLAAACRARAMAIRKRSESKLGREHLPSAHRKAAAFAICGYSTSGFGSAPSLRSHHSTRLYGAGTERAVRNNARAVASSLLPTTSHCAWRLWPVSRARWRPDSGDFRFQHRCLINDAGGRSDFQSEFTSPPLGSRRRKKRRRERWDRRSRRTRRGSW